MKLTWEASNKQKASACYGFAGISFIGWLVYGFGLSGVLFLLFIAALVVGAHFDDKKDAKGVDTENSVA